jgi:hypothetical protein
MYNFRKARWHSLDPVKIYNCTHRSQEKALETGLRNDYGVPSSYNILCSCSKFIQETTTNPSLEESSSERRPREPRIHRR